MAFNPVERESFRRRLADERFYARWRDRLGTEAWALLERSLGRCVA